MPGVLNSVIDLNAPQQQPQQEHKPLVNLPLSSFITKVTSPSLSACALISSTSRMLTSRICPRRTMAGAQSPTAVQASNIFPHPSPERFFERRHWQTPTAKLS